MKECICCTCGAIFLERERRPGKYCSFVCYSKSFPIRDKIKCIGCGVSFIPTSTTSRNNPHCSVECYRQHAKGEKHSCYIQNSPEILCRNCNKLFRPRSTKSSIFCSLTCWREYQKIAPKNGIVECRSCRKEFKRLYPDMNYCSNACRVEGSILDKSPAWKNGSYIHNESDREFVIVSTRGQEKRSHRYFALHRILVERVLGRELSNEEKVWHIDRNKRNNSTENLYLFPSQSALAVCLFRDEMPITSNIIPKGR